MPEKKRKDWREPCAAAAAESDPEKLASLVHQIIEALDESRQQARFQDKADLVS